MPSAPRSKQKRKRDAKRKLRAWRKPEQSENRSGVRIVHRRVHRVEHSMRPHPAVVGLAGTSLPRDEEAAAEVATVEEAPTKTGAADSAEADMKAEAAAPVVLAGAMPVLDLAVVTVEMTVAADRQNLEIPAGVKGFRFYQLLSTNLTNT
jgi:hypothetical protein